MEADDVTRNRRNEVEPNAEFLVDDGDRAGVAAALNDRDGNFTAGEETCLLAVVRNEIGSARLCRKPSLQRLINAGVVLVLKTNRFRRSLKSACRGHTVQLNCWVVTRPAQSFCELAPQNNEIRPRSTPAIHLCEPHLQHHLLRVDAPRHLQQIDHLLLR